MPTSIYAPNLPPGEINIPIISPVLPTPSIFQNPSLERPTTNLPIDPTNLSFYSPISRPDLEGSEDVLTNEIYVPSQLLDLYTLKGSKMLGSLLNPDLTTQYPATVTGTPNTFSNPGGPIVPFHQIYNFARNGDTYLSHINNLLVDNSDLSNDLNIPRILAITNLDTEHTGVNGGFPTNPLNDPTVYPPTTTHTSPIRGYFAQPYIPFSKFTQSFSPNGTYLTFIENGKDIYDKPYI
jgi:hypothetical protein